MGKTTFGFLLGFGTAVGVAYLAYRALLAMPEIEETPRPAKIESVRRH
jgi:hypothetical protein